MALHKHSHSVLCPGSAVKEWTCCQSSCRSVNASQAFSLSAPKHEQSLNSSAEVVPGYDITEMVWACTFMLTVGCFETSVRGEEEDLSRGVHDSLLLWEPWEESGGAS